VALVLISTILVGYVLFLQNNSTLLISVEDAKGLAITAIKLNGTKIQNPNTQLRSGEKGAIEANLINGENKLEFEVLIPRSNIYRTNFCEIQKQHHRCMSEIYISLMVLDVLNAPMIKLKGKLNGFTARGLSRRQSNCEQGN